jgi:hypothetical protein
MYPSCGNKRIKCLSLGTCKAMTADNSILTSLEVTLGVGCSNVQTYQHCSCGQMLILVVKLQSSPFTFGRVAASYIGHSVLLQCMRDLSKAKPCVVISKLAHIEQMVKRFSTGSLLEPTSIYFECSRLDILNMLRSEIITKLDDLGEKLAGSTRHTYKNRVQMCAPQCAALNYFGLSFQKNSKFSWWDFPLQISTNWQWNRSWHCNLPSCSPEIYYMGYGRSS